MTIKRMLLLLPPLLLSSSSFHTPAAPLTRRQSSCRTRLNSSTVTKENPSEETTVDVIVIGAGIGGLSAASLCARHKLKTICVEAHDTAGGVAHSFERRSKDNNDSRPFVFDSGPSLLSGMSGAGSTNPLRQLMDAVGVVDEVDWVTYDGWMVRM
jgi:NADPH-dependent 2,4-dienoyl-CoA reductase/sulfur reductase-like enzyme